MAANRYENFTIEVIDRSVIREADYNPRRIPDANLKKLERWFREKGKGQLAPLVVNSRTMTLVSGHQRLKVLDTLHKGEPYQLTVSMTDLDELVEVEANIFMNNPSAMGEWDMFKMRGIKEEFPMIDFEKDCGFDASDVGLMFGFETTPVQIRDAEVSAALTTDNFREMKKEQREKAKTDNKDTGSYHLNENDYAITFVFPNNHEKRKFMQKIRKPEKDTHLKSTVLYDIYNGVYNLSDLQE